MQSNVPVVWHFLISVCRTVIYSNNWMLFYCNAFNDNTDMLHRWRIPFYAWCRWLVQTYTGVPVRSRSYHKPIPTDRHIARINDVEYRVTNRPWYLNEPVSHVKVMVTTGFKEKENFTIHKVGFLVTWNVWIYEFILS